MKALVKNPLEPIIWQVNEVGLHYVRQCTLPKPKIESSSDAADILRPFFATCQNHHEQFYMLCLSQRNVVLAAFKVSAGGITGTVADVRLMMQTALLCNATGIVIAHNHPSGNPRFSSADISLTRKVKQACEILDLRLLDHVLLLDDGHVSATDEGLL
jgi:DNA repair protein RadC